MTPVRLSLIVLAVACLAACAKHEEGGEAATPPADAVQPTPGDATASADSMAAVEAAMAASPSAVPLNAPLSASASVSE